MKSFTNINPVFSENIMIVETTDPVHADNANAAAKQLLANTQVNKDTIEALKTSTGNTPDMAYDPESIYKIGDYCIYNNKLYKCISAIDEAEEWDASHWEETTITKEILVLNNKEVEVVDPTIATEVGFAADAKLTGDALREVSVNIAQKANASTVNTNLTNLSNRIASIENIQKNYVTGNQSGTVKFGTLLAKRKDQATVVFPKKFTKTPSISLSATSGSSGNTFLRATYASVNASSFVIQIENIDGALGITDVSVTWNAWV